MSAGIGQVLSIEPSLNLPIAYDRLHHSLMRLCIYRNDLIEIGQIDHHAPVAHGRITPVVSTPAHCDFQFVGSGVLDRLDYVLFVSHTNNQLRPALNWSIFVPDIESNFLEVGIRCGQDLTL